MRAGRHDHLRLSLVHKEKNSLKEDSIEEVRQERRREDNYFRYLVLNLGKD